MIARVRHWSWTANEGALAHEEFKGLEPEDIAAALWEKAHESKTYMVCQLERGEEKKTLHLQGYCAFSKAVRMRNVFGETLGFHFEPCKGSPQQNRAYCMKEDTRCKPNEEGTGCGPWEFGEPPGETKVTPLRQLHEDLKTLGWEEVRDKHGHLLLHYLRNAQTLWRSYHLKPRTEMTTTVWITGPTGVGKSHVTHEAARTVGAVYWKDNTKWWADYAGQPAVVIDDLDFAGWTRKYLLRLCDKWPFMVEPKGDQCHFNSKWIFITSVASPEGVPHLWNDEVARRIRRYHAQQREDLPTVAEILGRGD